jgi:hypothetical protein
VPTAEARIIVNLIADLPESVKALGAGDFPCPTYQGNEVVECHYALADASASVSKIWFRNSNATCNLGNVCPYMPISYGEKTAKKSKMHPTVSWTRDFYNPIGGRSFRSSK